MADEDMAYIDEAVGDMLCSVEIVGVEVAGDEVGVAGGRLAWTVGAGVAGDEVGVAGGRLAWTVEAGVAGVSVECTA